MSDFLAAGWLPWFLWLNIRCVAVLLLAGIVLFAVNRRAPASTRHLIAAAACMALLMLPVLTVLLPAHPAHIAPPNSPLLQVTPGGAPVNGDVRHNLELTGCALFVLWLTGVLIRIGRLAVGMVELRRLTLDSSPVRRGWLRDTFVQLAYTSGVFAPVHYRTATDPSFQTPVTWGHARPIILLPADNVLAGWPEERLQAVLRHEFAHIRRSDWLTHQLAQVACALYWYNPFVLRLAAGMEHLAEQACDDDVLLSGVEAPEYASHLLAVATAVRNASFGSYRFTPIQAMALPRSKVEARMLSILGRAVRRARVSGRMVSCALLVMTFITLPLATVQLAAKTTPLPHIVAVLEGPSEAAPQLAATKPKASSLEFDPQPSTVPSSTTTAPVAVNDVPIDDASQSVSEALAPAARPVDVPEPVPFVSAPVNRPVAPAPAPAVSKPTPQPPAAKPPVEQADDDQPYVDPLANYQPFTYPPTQSPGIVMIQGSSQVQVYPDGTMVTGGVILPPSAYRPVAPSYPTTGATTTGSTTTGSSTTGTTTTGGTTAGPTAGTTGTGTVGGTTGSTTGFTVGGTTSGVSTTGGTSGGTSGG